MPDESIFLLTEKQRAYFRKLKTEIYRGLHAAGIDTSRDFTVDNETLQSIADTLSYKAPAAYKKAHKALSERSFAIIREDLQTATLEEYSRFFPACPPDSETDAEAHAAHTAYLAEIREQIERDPRRFHYRNGKKDQFIIHYRDWVFQLSDKPAGKQFLAYSPEEIDSALADADPLYYVFPVFPETEAYRILCSLDDWKPAYTLRNGKKTLITEEIRAENPEYWGEAWTFSPSPDQLDALRKDLGLSDYRYIDYADFTDILFLEKYLKATIALPSVTISGNTPPIDGKQSGNGFSYIHQGTAINEYVKTQPTPDNVTVAGKNAIIKKQDYSIRLPYSMLPGLRASAYQLLDAIVRRYTENGARNPEVILTLDEYMTARGLKDRKQAKEQARADLQVLQSSAITWEEKRGEKTVSYRFVNVADWGAVEKDGRIIFTFGAKFHSVLSAYPVMPYPDFLLKINGNKNPNSYFFGRKIAEHKRMNAGKSNEDLISVKTLLSVARSIPSFDTVMQGNRNVTARIIDPFERDMDALGPDITWEYCKKANSPLSEDELSGMNYALFSSLLVHITWKDYPDQTQHIASRAAAIEAAREPAKKRKRKK